jgi:hypothetical protein
VRSYDDRPVPLFQWLPRYPARSFWVFVAGAVFMAVGMGRLSVELRSWQAGLVAVLLLTLSGVPIYVHNYDLRARRREATPRASH